MSIAKNILSQPVFLCGMMGSGKSTTGRQLAERLGVSFHDLDNLIEKKAKMAIPEIFADKGEHIFRSLERDAIIEACRNLTGVIALGGGSLQNQHITDHIKLNGWLIFLNTPVDTLLRRLKKNTTRPMLYNSEGKTLSISDKIVTLMKQRIPYYVQAHITIDTDDLPAGEIVDLIAKKLIFHEQKN